MTRLLHNMMTGVLERAHMVMNNKAITYSQHIMLAHAVSLYVMSQWCN